MVNAATSHPPSPVVPGAPDGSAFRPTGLAGTGGQRGDDLLLPLAGETDNVELSGQLEEPLAAEGAQEGAPPGHRLARLGIQASQPPAARQRSKEAARGGPVGCPGQIRMPL